MTMINKNNLLINLEKLYGLLIDHKVKEKLVMQVGDA